MRSFYILLAMAGAEIVSANPLFDIFDRGTCNSNNCARAVTGSTVSPVAVTRSEDCSHFMSATNSAASETAVPTYASACSGWQSYSSACSCFGVTSTAKTTLVDATDTSASSTKTSSSSSHSTSTTTKTSSTSTHSTSTTSKSSTSSHSSSTTSKSSSTSTHSSSTTSKGSSTSTHSTTSSTKTVATVTATACAKVTCLSDATATSIVNSFIYLLGNPNATDFITRADKLLANNFTDTSDSIDYLAGITLGSTTFGNKTAFIAGSGSQSPLIVKTYDIFHSCTKIAWRWVTVSGAGDDADKVKGIDTFYTDGCGAIYAVYAEFNSAAWLFNLDSPECSATKVVTYATTLTSSLPSTATTVTATST